MTKTMNDDLLATLNDTVHVVTYIKGRPLKSRIFVSICESVDSELRCLLYQTEVRLSRGEVLVRLHAMKEEIMRFCMVKENEKYADLFADDDWRAKLAYLADICGQLNIIIVSLQGLAATFLGVTDKLCASQEKPALWQTQLEKRNVSMCAFQEKLALW